MGCQGQVVSPSLRWLHAECCRLLPSAWSEELCCSRGACRIDALPPYFLRREWSSRARQDTWRQRLEEIWSENAATRASHVANRTSASEMQSMMAVRIRCSAVGSSARGWGQITLHSSSNLTCIFKVEPI